MIFILLLLFSDVNDFVNTTIPIHVDLPSRLQSSNGTRAYNEFFSNQRSLSDYSINNNNNLYYTATATGGVGGGGVDSYSATGTATGTRSRNVSIDNPVHKQALPDASLSEKLFEHIDQNKDGVVTFSDILLLPFSSHKSNEVQKTKPIYIYIYIYIYYL